MKIKKLGERFWVGGELPALPLCMYVSLCVERDLREEIWESGQQRLEDIGGFFGFSFWKAIPEMGWKVKGIENLLTFLCTPI